MRYEPIHLLFLTHFSLPSSFFNVRYDNIQDPATLASSCRCGLERWWGDAFDVNIFLVLPQRTETFGPVHGVHAQTLPGLLSHNALPELPGSCQGLRMRVPLTPIGSCQAIAEGAQLSRFSRYPMVCGRGLSAVGRQPVHVPRRAG